MRGFTLLELLVVIAVLAIVTVVGVPAFSSTLDRSALAASTNRVIGGLYQARSEAMRLQQDVALRYDSDARRYRLVDPSDDSVLEELETLASRVVVDSPAELLFNAEGVVPAGLERIRLESGQQRLICVFGTGAVVRQAGSAYCTDDS